MFTNKIMNSKHWFFLARRCRANQLLKMGGVPPPHMRPSVLFLLADDLGHNEVGFVNVRRHSPTTVPLPNGARTRHCARHPCMLWVHVHVRPAAQASRGILTPHLDGLAASGVVLRSYYTAPMCTPSRASLMTGRYAIRLGVQASVLFWDTPWGVPLGETFLPQHFQRAGWATALFGKW